MRSSFHRPQLFFRLVLPLSCLVLALLRAPPAHSAPGDVVSSMSSPGFYPSGLAWDGSRLWVANLRTAYDPAGAPNTDHLDQVDPATGAVLQTFSWSPNKYFHGLAWDGTSLWGDEFYDDIRKINPANGSLIGSFPAQGEAYGLTYDPKSGLLLQFDKTANLIHKFVPATGELVASIASAAPATGGHGLAWDGCYVWQTNTSSDQIYRIHPDTGAVVGNISAPANHGEGLAFDGTHLWVSDTTADRLYRIEIPEYPSGIEPDYDSDAVPDRCDNCVLKSNPDQADADGDLIGDVCDGADDPSPTPTPGATPSSTPGADPGDPADPTPEVGGCGCSLTAEASSRGTALASLVAAGAMLLVWRSRRRRRLYSATAAVIAILGCAPNGGVDSTPGDDDDDATTPAPTPTPATALLPRAYVNADVFGPAINSIPVFAAVPAFGLLTSQGAPRTTGDEGSSFGGDAESIEVHVGTRRLFATSLASIAVFDLDPSTGDPVPVAGSPFPTGGTIAYGIAVSPDGTRVYVANAGDDTGPADETISAFEVGAGGALMPLVGSPFQAGSPDPQDATLLVRMTRDGRFLYALTQKGSLHTYEIKPAGGLVETQGSPRSLGVGANSYGMRLDPSGTRLYVGESDKDKIHVFDIDPIGGNLSPIPFSPFPASNPGGMAFSPDGTRMYVSSWNASTLQGFTVAADGSLEPLAGSPFATGLIGLSSLSFDGAGTHLYVLDEFGKQVGVFTLAPDGTPSGVAGSPVATGEAASHRPSGLALSF